MKRDKSPLKIALKEYLLYLGKFKKSDRIYIYSVKVIEQKNGIYSINIRKSFNKDAYIHGVHINGNEFRDWVILKKRTEKIKKLKDKIDGIQHNKRTKTSM